MWPHANVTSSNPRPVQVEPGYGRARIRLATCHMRLGRFPAALAALEGAARPFQEPKEAQELGAKRAEVEALQARYSQVRGAAITLNPRT